MNWLNSIYWRTHLWRSALFFNSRCWSQRFQYFLKSLSFRFPCASWAVSFTLPMECAAYFLWLLNIFLLKQQYCDSDCSISRLPFKLCFPKKQHFGSSTDFSFPPGRITDCYFFETKSSNSPSHPYIGTPSIWRGYSQCTLLLQPMSMSLCLGRCYDLQVLVHNVSKTLYGTSSDAL